MFFLLGLTVAAPFSATVGPFYLFGLVCYGVSELSRKSASLSAPF